MSYVYVCNTSSEFISKVNIEDMVEVQRIKLGLNNVDKMGPHGICVFEDKLLVANCFGNNISIIKGDKEVAVQYIGSHCNDICVYNNNAYISCEDSNSIIVYDLNAKQITHQIPCENQPHSICIDFRHIKVLVANMQSDSVTIISGEEFNIIRNINVGAYPTKAIYSIDGEYIFVCESNLGRYERGNLSIISAKNFKILYKVQVGFSPIDIECDSEYCYISNFGEGTVSVINISKHKEVKRINVGGMPKCIKKTGDFLLVGDYYNNELLKVNIFSENKKAIKIGREPNGMAFA